MHLLFSQSMAASSACARFSLCERDDAGASTSAIVLAGCGDGRLPRARSMEAARRSAAQKLKLSASPSSVMPSLL